MSTTIVEYGKPVASGRREGWAKWFTGIDPEHRGAQAFVGEYLREGENELPEGALVVSIWWTGSVKNGVQMARIRRATSGELEKVSDAFEWRGRFVSLQKEAGRLLAAPAVPADGPASSAPRVPPTAEELAVLITRDGWDRGAEDWTEYLTYRGKLEGWPAFGASAARALAESVVAVAMKGTPRATVELGAIGQDRIGTAIGEALNRSITKNRIAYLDANREDAPPMLAALELLADNSADCGEVVEFRGKTETSDEWRVHVRREGGAS